MKLKVILEPNEDGKYTASVPALPGCMSEGEDEKDALKNIRVAINLYLDLVDMDKNYSSQAKVLEIDV